MVEESGTDTKEEDFQTGGDAGVATDTSKQRENL